MYPLITLGSAAIQTSMVAWIAALWVGAYLASRECQRGNIAGRGVVWNIVAIAVVLTVVGGRLAYAAQNPSTFSNPLQMVLPAPASLSLDAGVLFGVSAALAYIGWRKIPLARLLDALAPGALGALAIVAVGQWLSGDAYGTLSSLPWAMALGGESRHPVQLYDALGALVGWVVVGQIVRFYPFPDGSIATLASAWYSVTRLVVDAFRDESVPLSGGYRPTQVIALIVLLASLGIMARIIESEHTRGITGSVPERR
ncbi:MAG: prolipoprotein diacylglyceryl transferase [Chloroflexi bacterium]|nr:prolipoprotein diacylglyceryl transferase [Chloroflexota bacterium]